MEVVLVLALLVKPVVQVVQVEQAPVVEVSVVEMIVVGSVFEDVGYGIWIGSPVVD